MLRLLGLHRRRPEQSISEHTNGTLDDDLSTHNSHPAEDSPTANAPPPEPTESTALTGISHVVQVEDVDTSPNAWSEDADPGLNAQCGDTDHIPVAQPEDTDPSSIAGLEDADSSLFARAEDVDHAPSPSRIDIAAKMMNEENSSASPEMVPLLEDDEITPAPLTSVAVEVPPTDDVNPPVEINGVQDYGAVAKSEKEEKQKKPKKDKSGRKGVSDELKTDMAAERTFFKWLWTGLHTGAIGSFIFITFDSNKEDPMRIVVVGFAWLVAFLLVLYGTYAYYRRRHALRTGNIDVIPSFTREHSPLVVVVALALVVGAALSYALWGGATAKNKGIMPGL